MYANTNYPTKKALKDAVKNGEKVGIYQPNNIFNVQVKPNTSYSVEGPWYPEPHKWYARVTLDAEGNIAKVS